MAVPYGQTRAPRCQSAAGFTLLETLAAFVLFCLALAPLLQAGAFGTRAVAAAAQTEEALAVAKSHLALASAAGGSALQTGEDGRYRWEVEAQQGTAITGPRHQTATLVHLTITVSWQDGPHPRQLQLQTDRLMALAP